MVWYNIKMKFLKNNSFKKIPEVVIFDLDNTLYDYNLANNQAMLEIEKQVCQDFMINKKKFYACFNSSRDVVKKNLGNTASSHSRLIYFQKMIEMLGFKTQPLMTLDLEQKYWRIFLMNMKLFPHVKELLEYLKILGSKLLLITDLTAQIQFRKVVYLGLDKFFDFIITSEESGADKFLDNSFKLAIEKVKMDKKTVVWSVGDCTQDIEGSKGNFHCITFQKINFRKEVIKKTDAYFFNYKSFLNFVKKSYK